MINFFDFYSFLTNNIPILNREPTRSARSMLILLQVLFVILFGFIQGFLVIFHLLLGLGWKQVGKLELGLLRLKEKKSFYIQQNHKITELVTCLFFYLFKCKSKKYFFDVRSIFNVMPLYCPLPPYSESCKMQHSSRNSI